MNYTKFIAYARTHIKAYLPAEYEEAEVTVSHIKKLDEEYTGLMVRRKGQISAPVINIKMFFRRYQNDEPLEELMMEMARQVFLKPPMALDPEALNHYDEIASKLFVRLSSAKKGEALMEDSPHQVIGDLLLTYHIFIPGDENSDGWFSARVTNEMLNNFGITKDQLERDALKNTTKLFVPKLESLMEAVTGEPEEDPRMLVVTNQETTYGANMLFVPGMMEEVATKLKGNFFAIPSSIHEFIVVIDDGDITAEDLRAMLETANQTVVRPEEILSNTVYHYDEKTKVFSKVA